jgi:hypothetical protein
LIPVDETFPKSRYKKGTSYFSPINWPVPESIMALIFTDQQGGGETVKFSFASDLSGFFPASLVTSKSSAAIPGN